MTSQNHRQGCHNPDNSQLGVATDHVCIHPTARVSPLADIEKSVRGTRCIIGQRCVIDSFVKIKPVGGTGDIIVGSSVYINSGCVLYSGNGIIIGNNVSIAANCTFAPVNHEYRSEGTLIQMQGFRPSKGGIIIEDDVWIGANTVLLDGVVLRRGCVIGAHSLVRGEIGEFLVCAGNPLTIMGRRSQRGRLAE